VPVSGGGIKVGQYLPWLQKKAMSKALAEGRTDHFAPGFTYYYFFDSSLLYLHVAVSLFHLQPIKEEYFLTATLNF